MKRMDVEEFLKLVKKMGACTEGVDRFKALKGTLKQRLQHVREHFSSDWKWLTEEAYVCSRDNCTICKPGAHWRLWAYLKSAGLL